MVLGQIGGRTEILMKSLICGGNFWEGTMLGNPRKGNLLDLHQLPGARARMWTKNVFISNLISYKIHTNCDFFLKWRIMIFAADTDWFCSNGDSQDYNDDNHYGQHRLT